ncbi:MAG: hypothetical protein Q7S29_00870 [Candidatus Peribacter sp.]|nr:hypothetical protein [Candidatus Peribacter sp.]
MNILFLTAEEQKVFEALPANLKEGWQVEGASLVSERPEELTVRQGMASFDQPELRAACERLAEAKEGAAYEKAMHSLDADAFTREQLAEIFFVLGVDALTHFIAYVLSQLKTDEDMELVSALTHIRSMLSEVNASQS